MSERKAVIKNADMSEEMQQDAVDCATQALEKYNIEKVRLQHFNLKFFSEILLVLIFQFVIVVSRGSLVLLNKKGELRTINK